MLEHLLRSVAQDRGHAHAATFYAKGNKVLFRNKALLFRGDSPADAPERELLAAYPIEGDGEALTASEVAQVIAEILNRALRASA